MDALITTLSPFRVIIILMSEILNLQIVAVSLTLGH